MPSSTSAALNRVIGGNPSSIYGSLSANGILYLINPSGILVGPGGTVNAASFMASTLDVSTEQFMNAKNGAGMNFYGSSGESIINQGNITAEKGDVFLIAQKVENRGTINAANGTAGMVGSGQSTDVMVHEVGGKGFAIRVAQLQGEAASGSNRDLPDGEELLNEGSINAAQAELNASGNVYALAIRNSGTIRAKAVVANADGTVRLDGGLGDVRNTGTLIAKNAGDEATAAGGKIEMTEVKIDSADTTIVQGKVDVAAPSAGAKGGKVELLGERVGLFDGAKVDASGGAGGGTVLVGGDYLGGQTPKPEIKNLAKQEAEPVKNAKATVIADTAEIKADATVNGDGGKIILWSDEYTGFYGDLFARGGEEGGNGGFIETSSKDNLQAFGLANTAATLGKGGHWLLDPTSLTVLAGTSVNGSFTGTPATVWTTSPDPASTSGAQFSTATVGITPLLTALGLGSVTISTSSTGSGAGFITVNGSIANTGNANSLTLIADTDITINNTMTLAGSISLNANGGSITTNANISSTTGTVSMIAGGGAITLNGTTTAAGILGRSSGDIDINNSVTSTGGGTIQLISAGDVTGPGLISLDPVGGLSIDTTGDVSVSVTAGPVAVRTTGDVTLFGGAAGTTTVGLVNGINGLSGADISVTAGTIELGGAPVDATGDFTALAATGIDFIAPSNRFSPAVTTGGDQSFQGVITLSADTVLRSAGDMRFNNTIDGAFDLLLQVGGATDLLDQVGGTTPLTSFRQEGGSVNFYATTLPAITTAGSTTFDGANLVLWENTTFSSGSDLIVLGTIDSSFADTPVVLDVTAAGNVILDGAVGGNAALGAVSINATGGQIAINSGITTLPGTLPFHTGADGSISLTAGGAVVIAGAIDTRGGLSADTGIGGDLTITSGGGLNQNIQIESTINTRGGSMTFQNAVFFTGASNLDTTAGNVDGDIHFNDAVDGSALATIQGGTGQVTFTGAVGGESPLQLDLLSAGGVTFSSSVLFGATANITSYSGAVSFASTVNKINGGVLLLDLGNQSLGFSGAVGGANPFSLQVTSSGAVTLGGPVNMGGNFDFLDLSGPFAATGAINSVGNGTTGFDLTINPVNTTATVGLREVGTTSALGAVTVGSGGGVTTLNGNIFTAGGAVNLGGPVTLATGAITIDTTRLGNTAGAGIGFRQTLDGARSLTLVGGSSGGLSFGGNVSGLTGLNVTSGGSLSVSNAGTFVVAGDIFIQPQVVTKGSNLSMSTSNNGDITLNSGLTTQNTSGGIGGTVTLSAGGTGDLLVNGVLNASGFSGRFIAVLPDGSGTYTYSTSGFDGGSVTLSGASVTTGGILADGDKDETGFSRGGNGGTITITSAGTKSVGFLSVLGALGTPAGAGGAINLAGAGANNLNGLITISGGDGQSAGDSGGAAGTLNFSNGGAVVLKGGVTANGGAGLGGGSGGSAGVIVFPSLTLASANLPVTALGGANGTGTGRGADGNLTFNAVNGQAAGVNSLKLDVGAGTVTFNGAVGTALIPLGQITIQNAQNVTFGSTLSATKFVQNASVPVGGIYTTANQAGTTAFNGAVTLSGTGTVLDLTGYNFTFGGGLTATTGSVNGVINGVFAVNSAFGLGGDMTLAAGAVTGISPRVDLNVAGAAITTTAGSLSFGTLAKPLNVRLRANTTLDTGVNGGSIAFGGLVNSDDTARSLTLNSGGVVTFNSFVGNLSPLASLTTDAGGSLNLAAVGTRSTPSISATGGLTFNDQVQLNAATVLKADAVTLSGTGLMDGANSLLVLLNTGGLNFVGQVGQSTALTSLRVEGGSGTTMGFAGTQANPSIKTTGNQNYGNAVNLADDTVLNAGSMDFLSTINGASSLLLDAAGNINLYGKVGTGTALTQFQTSGGGILNLLAAGATGLSPSIQTTGAQLFGSSLVLGEDSFLNSTGTGDFIFLNTIDSRLPNQPRSLSVVGQERIVLEAAAGGTAKLKSASLTAGGELAVNAGIQTYGGAIGLTSGTGTVVLAGLTDTTGDANLLGGAVTLNGADEVIFKGGSITTFGGAVGVTGPAFINTATTITTTSGGLGDGDVTFGGTLDGLSPLTVNAGTGALSFTGAVGGTNPFGMTVNSSGGVTFSQAVRMGGAFTFNQLSGPFSASDSISGAYGLTINTINSGSTITLQEVGTKIVADQETLVPVAFLTIGNGNSAINLNGNITTSGGVINFGSPVTVNQSITLNTTARGATGGGISFLNTVKAEADAPLENLTILASLGGLTFGSSISGFDVFSIVSAGSMNFTSSGSVSAGVITINTDVTSQRNVTLTTTRGDILISGGISARPSDSYGLGGVALLNSAGMIEVAGGIDVSGRSGTFIAPYPDGSGTYTFATVGYRGGKVNFTAASEITVGTINANGGDNFGTGGNGGDGGQVNISGGGKITASTILANGGNDGVIGGNGGTIGITRTTGAGDFAITSISAYGGDGKNQGGNGGNINLTALQGDLKAPITYINQGGKSTTGAAATEDIFSGNGGLVSLEATVGSVYFQNQTLTLQGNSSLAISAGSSVVLATDLVTKSGGVVITTNEGTLKDSPRGSIEIEYGVGGSGDFYMPTSAYLATQGGDAKVSSTGTGTVTISGVNTVGKDVNGGSINIEATGTVLVAGALETSGATPVLPAYGRSGGSVNITGGAISVNQIDTSGSASLTSATAPAFGGAGGSVTITGTTITITSGTSVTGTTFSINTSGGTGLGTTNATGGAGGSITLNGNVVLNSGDSTRSIIILNTQGGTYTGGASNGVGGNISVSGTLTGTKTTSNTLDVRYGSGTVTLGDAAADTITLGTLITAADDARSTGNLIINGKLELGTLTTYARGYGIEINGGGTIANTVTFNNTGNVALGSLTADTIFSNGVISTAPATSLLKGNIISGTSENPGQGTPLSFGVATLVGNTTLDSNGSNVSLGTIDGPFNLDFASGIGSGVVDITSAVGASSRVGTITVSSGITQPVLFRSSVMPTCWD
ncbi:MAG: filamentous hemagglutinin N-terminal domain-containing protein [Verrucomicrobia bacterium]|nr:filamentous hemagglutinin N-terminal domain-containing protein [Verrucomicrobiota bacterium]